MNTDDPFVRDRTITVELRDGSTILVRPIVPADRQKLLEGLARLSPESRFRRFLRPMGGLTGQELTYLTEVDYHDHFAWVALDPDTPDRRGVGVARYVRLPDDPAVAEAAVVVLDDYQRRGIGTILLRLTAETAYQNGIRTFRSWVAPDNTPVLTALDNRRVSRRAEDGVVVVDIPLPVPPGSVENSGLYATLRAAARGEIRVERHHLGATDVS